MELFALAKANGVNFLFEASVAGGIPVLNPLTRCLGANEITEVSGILNGTTNYILTQMLENGESYADALSNAQRLGYAEVDPTADVEGIDAARKSCILSGLAFGKNVSPDDIHVEGISKVDALDAQFAEAGGMKIKLLGRTLVQNGKRFCFVSPHLVKSSALLAGVNDVFNAVCVRGSAVGEVLFAGPGAGRYPTASAVVGDIIDIVKNPGRMQPAGWEACAEKPAVPRAVLHPRSGKRKRGDGAAARQDHVASRARRVSRRRNLAHRGRPRNRRKPQTRVRMADFCLKSRRENMARIVQKFGGSSVANAERIFRVAKIITDSYAKGNEMCVVLSAQGDTTDDLIAKAEEINPNASKREMDMLLACGEQMSIALMAMAIEKLGYPVVSLCGWQVGMNTSSTHSFARIKKVTCERVKEELDKKRIVLVAGFQGVDKYGRPAGRSLPDFHGR